MSEYDASTKKVNEPAHRVPPIQTAEPVGAADAHPATQEQLTEVKEKMSAFERSTLRWTKVTCGVFAVTLVFIGLQWNVMKSQLQEMKTGGNDTHALAEATLASSRAWVVVQGTGFGFTQDKNYPSGRVVLADSGESPAFGIDGWRCVEIRSYEPAMQNGELQKSPSAICLAVVGGTLGKGIPITMDAFVPKLVPENFSKDTEADGPHFYYWGRVSYAIYPDDGRRHWTNFCLKNGGNQLSECREGGYEAN